MSEEFVVSGIRGVVDDVLTTGDQTHSLHMENMYALPNGQIKARPGIEGFDTTGATEDVQCFGHIEPTAGGAQNANFLIRNGEIWAAVASNYYRSWIKYISASELSTAGITVSATRRIFWCAYNGQIVFNDEVNQPWMWNGLSTSSDVTLLANAPATAVGRPTAYSGKLFFIKSGFTIVWSEEADATIGYEAGGYNNAWDVQQTSSDAIRAIHGTNRGLFYWRINSIGLITGAATTDFQTSSTQDTIATSVGTNAPNSIVQDGERIFFTDRAKRPYVIIGDTVVPLWHPMRRLFEQREHRWKDGRTGSVVLGRGFYDSRKPETATSVVYAPARLLLVFAGYTTRGTNIPNLESAIVFSLDTLEYQGFWDINATVTAVGEGGYAVTATYDTGPTVWIGVGVVARVGAIGRPGDTEADTLTSGTNDYYARRIVGPPQAWSIDRERDNLRLDLLLGVPISTTGVIRQHVSVLLRTPDRLSDGYTPAGYFTEQTATFWTTTGGAASEVEEQHASFAIPAASGRWFAVDLLLKFVNDSGTEIAHVNTTVGPWTIQVSDVRREVEVL